MQLLYSPTSPYARKLRVLIRELDILDRVDEVAVAPLDNPAELRAANPLMRVPALIVDAAGTETIFDSPVIAMYLCQMPSRQLMIPVEGDAHWWVRTIEALADGILDSALALRIGGQTLTHEWVERYGSAIDRALEALPRRLAPLDARLVPDDAFSYAHVSVVCALEYLDFRFADRPWRQDHPALAALHAKWAERPSVRDTRPPAS